MTGTLTDIGVLIGHQIGRQLQQLSRWLNGTHESEEKRAATLVDIAKEWTQLKLLCLLLISFFAGSGSGMAMFNAYAADALLLPALCEGFMGLGHFIYRACLRPMWKSRMKPRTTIGMEAEPSAKAHAQTETVEDARSQDSDTFDGVSEMAEKYPDQYPDKYPAISPESGSLGSDGEDERKPLSPKIGRRWNRDDATSSYDTTKARFEAEEAALGLGENRPPSASKPTKRHSV